MRAWITVWGACLLFIGAIGLPAEETTQSPLDAVGRQAGSIQKKRVAPKQWGSSETLPMADKRISMEDWPKHFSSVGSKRAPIEVQADSLERVEVDRKKFPVRGRTMSRLDQQMARVERKARIAEKDTPLLLRDHEVYAMMLQGKVFEEEIGKQLSLRDLNRFQFRRNRGDAAVPTQKAGSGER